MIPRALTKNTGGSVRPGKVVLWFQLQAEAMIQHGGNGDDPPWSFTREKKQRGNGREGPEAAAPQNSSGYDSISPSKWLEEVSGSRVF